MVLSRKEKLEHKLKSSKAWWGNFKQKDPIGYRSEALDVLWEYFAGKRIKIRIEEVQK